MTVAAATAKAGPYTGNNVTTSFAFSFKVFADADVRVVETLISTEVETDLVLNTDYTVTRNADQDNNPGGSITYKVAGVTTALPSTKTITLVGNFNYEQPTDIPNGGAWFASVVENALDRITLLTKQLKEALDRAVKVPVSSSTDPDALIASLTADAATAAAAAAAAASSAAAAAAAIPSGALGYTPVNITGDTMTGELVLPSINVGGSGSVTALGNAATKKTGIAIGDIPLWEDTLLNGSMAKTATYKIVAADRGKLVDCSGGSWTLDVDAAATLGAGFVFAVLNSGTGTITIDPNLSETVDGVATLAIGPGESGFAVCTGTAWRTVGRTFITYRTANTGMPPAGSANSAAHPLARIPDNARIELLCVIAEHGFGVGTVVEATGEWPGTGAASPIEVWKTSTAVGFNFSSGETFFLRDVSTGVAFIPTGANWVYRFVLD